MRSERRWMEWVCCLSFMLFISTTAHAESEYDMYRVPVVPTQSIVLLDLSLKMGCAPDQEPPVQGEIACGYVMQGFPPFQPDIEKQNASRLSLVKKAFLEYSHTSSEALTKVGLATYSNRGGVIRVPIDAPAANGANEFLQSMNSLTVGENASLLGGLLEVAHYFSGQSVVFGRLREAQADVVHADDLLPEQYAGYLPRWLTETVSHPGAVQSGFQWLHRDVACADGIKNEGAVALLQPTCANEHYEIPPGQTLLYNAPIERDCGVASEAPWSAPRRQLLLLTSQDIQQPEGLDYVVAGEPLGLWIHRFLDGNTKLDSFDDACPAQPGSGEFHTLENCAVAIAETLSERYNVSVSVAAMGHESEFLARLAAAGGGHYFSVDNAQDLQVILEAILPAGGAIADPVTEPRMGAVLPVEGRDKNDHVFTLQFQPSARKHWLGNLKRYRLASETGAPVFRSESGGTGDKANVMGSCKEGAASCINNAARSAWTHSARPDGAVVTRGGAAEVLPSIEQRNNYVQHGEHLVPLVPAPSIRALTHEQQQIILDIARQYGWQGENLINNVNDPLVVKALDRYNRLAGVDPDNAEYERLKQSDLHPLQHREAESNSLGATVFGAPLRVSYVAEAEERLDVIWWSASDGFLRAINAETGELLVSILPEAVIPQIIAGEPAETGEVIPGLDTSWVALHHDQNHDGQLRHQDGDFLYLYGGMRRGGKHVYAWDVTDLAKPELLFDISPQTSGFSALGYTWSTPLLSRLWLPGQDAPQTVLVFGGGYDNRLDTTSRQSADVCSGPAPCGAAIYFVQASGRGAGRLLWTIDNAPAQSRHSRAHGLTAPIAAPLKALDVEGDGIADFLYALDLEGALFRIQLPQNDNSSLSVEAVASLKQSGALADNTFFFAPSVALDTDKGGGQQVLLALGSGTITQPLSSQRMGQLYIVKDVLPHAREGSATHLTPDSPDAMELSVASVSSARSKRLWILPTDTRGEKLAAAPLIVDNKAFFSTFVPPVEDNDSCGRQAGSQRLWALDLQTGRPLFDAAGEINSLQPTRYSSALTMHAASQMTPLLADGHLHLLRGAQHALLGNYRAKPEKVRWKQLLSGPRVKHY